MVGGVGSGKTTYFNILTDSNEKTSDDGDSTTRDIKIK